MASFICDSNLPPALARLLRARGHAASRTFELSLGSAGDSTIWRYAKRTGAITLTKDRDFVREDQLDPGPSVVLICLGNCSNAVLFAKLSAALPALLAEIERGRRVVFLQ